MNDLEDSGARTEFDTGARRDLREGKGRYDLMPTFALMRLARHYEAGADKYGERNWEKGIPLHTFLDSAFRHLLRWLWDRQLGTDHSEDHLSAAIWNIMCMVHTEEMIRRGKLPADLDDLPGGNDGTA